MIDTSARRGGSTKQAVDGQRRLGRLQRGEHAGLVEDAHAHRHQHAAQAHRAGAHLLGPGAHREEFGHAHAVAQVGLRRFFGGADVRADEFRQLAGGEELRLEKPAAQAGRVGDQRELVGAAGEQRLDAARRLARADEFAQHQPGAAAHVGDGFVHGHHFVRIAHRSLLQSS
jgi:hypothetical protein